MNKNEHYQIIKDLMEAGKVIAPIKSTVAKALSLLGDVTTSQQSEIVDLPRWSKMYATRHITLKQKGKDCGGFDETLSALSEESGPIDLVLLESYPYVAMVLVRKSDGFIVGSIYIERDKDSIVQ